MTTRTPSLTKANKYLQNQTKLLSLVLLLCTKSLFAQTFESGREQNTLIQIYTSEACSSCPPAEAWLNRFIDHPELFKNVIPLSFHVDYWNHLHWQDRFSKPEYSARQYRLKRVGRINLVYTPGVLINSKLTRQWNRPKAYIVPKSESGQLIANLTEKTINISFDTPTKNAHTAHAALLGFDFKTSIKSGENKGRELNHHFVVLEHHQTRKQTSPNSWALKLPSSNITSNRCALAVWIEDKHMRPLQSLANWIPCPPST